MEGIDVVQEVTMARDTVTAGLDSLATPGEHIKSRIGPMGRAQERRTTQTRTSAGASTL